jgi:hypothetical protein
MKLRLAALALAAMCVAGTASAGANDSKVKVVNSSLWTIAEMYMSSTSTQEWGPDQLGENVIDAQGGTYLLHGVPCGEYDVRLVDEDGDECEIREVGLCGENHEWGIADEDLLTCQVETGD